MIIAPIPLTAYVKKIIKQTFPANHHIFVCNFNDKNYLSFFENESLKYLQLKKIK